MFKNLRLIVFGIAVGLSAAALIILLNQKRTATPIKLLPPPPTETPQPIRVYVTGAVKNPGVYELPAGSIVQEALKSAGGLIDNAPPDKINLAAKLNDGQQLTIGDTATTVQPNTLPSPSTVNNPATLININTASLDELQKLPRVGVALAQRIIDYRTKNGPFKQLEELKNVSGIGDATYNGLATLITLK